MEEKVVYMTPKEYEILKTIYSLKWGEVTIKVKDGKPVMISKREDVKLTE